MTPQERQMIDELFDRLAKLDAAPRDSEAEAAIIAGLRRAPNATYALVQTVLVQDEALRRANDRIEELEGREPARNPPGGFLDSMRGTMGLDPAPSRGSVPNVQPSAGGTSRPVWNTGQVLNAAPQQGADYADPRAAGAMPGAGGGSSFLGTAAAAAAGMIGGSLLMNSIRGLTGGGQQQSLGGLGGASTGSGDKASPWSKDASGGDLARDAGLGDIGKGNTDAQKQSFANQDDSTRQDYASNDADDDDDSDSDDDDDYDDDDGDDGDDGDGSDFA